MTTTRRQFLKTASMATGAAAGGAPILVASVPAQAQSKRLDNPDLPRGLTLGTIRSRGEWRLAVRTEKGVLDVTEIKESVDLDVPETMDELLAHGGGNLQRLVAFAADSPRLSHQFRPEHLVEFGPCVPNPGKIVCVGLNYRRHAAEVKAAVPTTPVLFNKFNNTLMGNRGTLRLPTKVATQFDYEVELVIVIGRTAHQVSEQNALTHVFGYCTGNDFSARDLQRKTSQIMLGKTSDGFAPLGPWLVTADQIADPNALDLWCEVNGERRQSSNTADMIFNCKQIVSYISQILTLRPGDIIFTGTPEGVILGMPEDKRVWLKAGDRIRCAVEPLGVLEFKLSADQA